MEIPQKQLMFDISPILNGHFMDRSKNGNDASQAADSIVRTDEGWGSLPTKGCLSIANDDSLDASGDGGLVIMVRSNGFTEQAAGNRLAYKQGAYDFYFAGSTTLSFHDGTIGYNFSGGHDYVGAKTIGVRHPGGTGAAELWIDGKKVSTAGGNTTVGSSSNTLYIGNALGTANKISCPILDAVGYARGDIDMTDLHERLISRRTFFKPTRALDEEPSVGPVKEGMAFNAVIENSEIIDQGPNYYDGTIYSDIAGTSQARMPMGRTPWGEPCLMNEKGTEKHINFGAAANVQYAGADTVFGYAQWFKCSSDGAQMLMSRSGNYFLQKISAGNLQLSMGSGAWTVTTSPVRDDIWHLYSFFVDEDYEYVYIDGEQVGKRARTGTPGGGTLRIGQYVITGFDIDGGIGPQVFYKSFTNLAEYESELRKEWNRVANKVIYHVDFSDAPIGHSATTESEIPGTEWRVNSISGQIKVDENGDKYITSPSVGNVLEASGLEHTFGRLEIDCKPELNARCRHSHGGPGQFTIVDIGDSANQRMAYTNSVGGVLFATANASITTDRQKWWIDKKANSATLNTSIYKDEVLATAAVGSNPCTDLTNFTRNMQLATYSNVRIYSITKLFGVPLPV